MVHMYYLYCIILYQGISVAHNISIGISKNVFWLSCRFSPSFNLKPTPFVTQQNGCIFVNATKKCRKTVFDSHLVPPLEHGPGGRETAAEQSCGAVATDDCQPRLVETTFSDKSPLKIDLVSSSEAEVDRTTKLMVSALLQQVSSVK